MSVIVLRRFIPTIGKSALMNERVRIVGQILERAGGKVRMARAISGDDAGTIHLSATVADFAALAQLRLAMEMDPAYAELIKDREREPAGEMHGPEVYRTVFGAPSPDRAAVVHREYIVTREHRDSLFALLPEVDALLQGHDIKMVALVPVFSSDMSRLIVRYLWRSLAELGAGVDTFGLSNEFQAIVNRAAAFGTLARTRVMVNM